MSTTVLKSPTEASPAFVPPAGDVRLTLVRVVNSEWIKFRTLRSTIWTLVVTVLVMVGMVTLFSGVLASQGAGGRGAPVSIDVFSIAASMASLAAVVLGVLVVTGEYSTGMIRSTLAAVPRRLPALWAKAVVLAVSIFVVSAVATGISLVVMQLFLGGKGLAPDLGDAQTLRVLAGVPLYLTAIALFSFSIGAILRHSAGALATVLGLLLVVQNLFMIPWKPLQYISPFLPGTAGVRIVMTQASLNAMTAGAPTVGAVLSPWQGFAVLLAWVAVLLTAAAVLLRRRNA
jgi:ABC-2 type transport system permease protein